MAAPVHDFGSALSADAEAIGPPGQRRFRLLVLAGSRTASVWMEKEQLAGTGEWLGEMLTRLGATAGPADEPLPAPAACEIDFRASQLALGYDDERDAIVLQAFEGPVSDDDPAPLLRCHLSRGQARWLAARIARVVAAGRPACPLCQQPMDPEGHQCIRGNGHRPTRLVG